MLKWLAYFQFLYGSDEINLETRPVAAQVFLCHDLRRIIESWEGDRLSRLAWRLSFAPQGKKITKHRLYLTKSESFSFLSDPLVYDRFVACADERMIILSLFQNTFSSYKISEFTPAFASLANSLTRLYLGGSRISDISMLASFHSLRELSLYRAPVRDVSPLAAHPSLQILHLFGTHVNDISDLSDLPNLRELWLGPILPDLTPLQKFPSLRYLRMGQMENFDFPLLDTLARAHPSPNLEILVVSFHPRFSDFDIFHLIRQARDSGRGVINRVALTSPDVLNEPLQRGEERRIGKIGFQFDAFILESPCGDQLLLLRTPAE
jgi:hypothetical protein